MGNNSVHGSLKRRRKKSTEEITDDPFKSEENAPQTILDFYDKRDEDALSDKLIEFDAEESEIQAFYKGM